MSKLFECKSCGSSDYIISMSGNNTGLYCAKCHKWQKWLNKTEVKLFSEDSQKQTVKHITNVDRIRNMSDEELAQFIVKMTDNMLFDSLEDYGYSWESWLQSESEE